MSVCLKSYRVCSAFPGIGQRNGSILLPYSRSVVGQMRGVIAGAFLLAASAAAAQASDLAVRQAHARLLVLTPKRDGAVFRYRDAPLMLGHTEPHYQARPSGLDRFDPSAMRMFGGQIGGNGVKGGAVVSLTWATITPTR